MTKDWITNNLEVNENEVVVIEKIGENDFIGIPISDLVALMGGTSDTPSYDELISLPISDGGWRKYFDQWKTKGILN